MGIKSNQGRKGAEDTFDFLLAGRNVLLGTLRECKGLGERADRLRSLLPLERFAHDVRTGCDAIVSIRCEGPRVALASNARAEHAEAASGETVSSGLNQREALEERSQHAS